MQYELYGCGFKLGCKTIKEFEADSDEEAATIGRKAVDFIEKSTRDCIYREYLWRVDGDEKVEIEI